MTKEYSPSKFDPQRDANKPGQGQGQDQDQSHNKPGMGKEYPQQGNRPGEPRKPSEGDRNR